MTPPPAWADLPFFAHDWPAIRRVLEANPGWLPGPAALFRALELTPPDAVRVVILGQDPYPNRAHAMGLAFSVPPGTRPLPRSLANIFRELQDDTGISRSNGDLTGWAKQGVLLLNPVLTVPEGESHGHRALGWQRLAAQVLARCAERPTAFLLWGKPAQTLALPLLGPAQAHGHLILTSAHPSPLSARRGFFGSRPFSRINHWLYARGEPQIDWSA